jgi:hypothetical protein
MAGVFARTNEVNNHPKRNTFPLSFQNNLSGEIYKKIPKLPNANGINGINTLRCKTFRLTNLTKGTPLGTPSVRRGKAKPCFCPRTNRGNTKHTRGTFVRLVSGQYRGAPRYPLSGWKASQKGKRVSSRYSILKMKYGLRLPNSRQKRVNKRADQLEGTAKFNSSSPDCKAMTNLISESCPYKNCHKHV